MKNLFPFVCENMRRKNLTNVFIGLMCLGPIIPCLIVAGCSKNFDDNTKGGKAPTTAPTLVTLAPAEEAARAEEAKQNAATKIQVAFRDYKARAVARAAKARAAAPQQQEQLHSSRSSSLVDKVEGAAPDAAAEEEVQTAAEVETEEEGEEASKLAKTKTTFEQRTAHNNKRSEEIRNRRGNGQKVENKKRDNSDQTAGSPQIVKLKEKKENRAKVAQEKLTKELEQAAAAKNDDTGIQTSPIWQDNAAEKVVEAAQDNTDTEQDENTKWELNVGSEFSPEKGKELLEEIFNGREIKKDTEQVDVAKIMRYLFQKAQQKDQTFDEGTYLIEDPDGLFFNFLTSLKGSYKRISSHTYGDSTSSHYGFDVPEGWMQPENKRHILFFLTEKDGNKKLFLKPENYGIKQWVHFFLHGAEYVESLAVRGGLVTQDPETQRNHKKERTKYLPDDIKELLTKCKDLLEMGSRKSDTGNFELVEDSQKLTKGLHDQGIAYLRKLINEKDITISKDLSKVLEELEEKLKDRKLDHLDIRVAQEVIFTKEELIGSSKATATATSGVLGKENEQASTGTKNGNGSPQRGNSLIQAEDETSTTDTTAEVEDEDDFDIISLAKESKEEVEDKKLAPGAKVAADAQLSSSMLRHVIQQWGFEASKKNFKCGGVEKNLFFYKQDNNSKEKTYIAFAHNEESGHFTAQRGGERSISEVLEEIKNSLEEDKEKKITKFKILIPLQQISKGHWTLLEIRSTPSTTPEKNVSPLCATHYDSKGFMTASFFKDFLLPEARKGRQRVEEAVKILGEGTKVTHRYKGTQGTLDHHNCGRYVLLQLGKLLELKSAPQTIADINKILSGAKKDEQSATDCIPVDQ